jgi:hypothetical protein
MANNVSPNKLNDRDRRRVENIRDRLQAQGVGEDEATKRAVEEVVAGGHSGQGGGKAGGDSAQSA